MPVISNGCLSVFLEGDWLRQSGNRHIAKFLTDSPLTIQFSMFYLSDSDKQSQVILQELFSIYNPVFSLVRQLLLASTVIVVLDLCKPMYAYFLSVVYWLFKFHCNDVLLFVFSDQLWQVYYFIISFTICVAKKILFMQKAKNVESWNMWLLTMLEKKC